MLVWLKLDRLYLKPAFLGMFVGIHFFSAENMWSRRALQACRNHQFFHELYNTIPFKETYKDTGGQMAGTGGLRILDTLTAPLNYIY